MQGNEGGVSQTGDDQEQFSSGKGNALLGGDLKDSRSNENAAQNNVSDVHTCFHLMSNYRALIGSAFRVVVSLPLLIAKPCKYNGLSITQQARDEVIEDTFCSAAEPRGENGWPAGCGTTLELRQYLGVPQKRLLSAQHACTDNRWLHLFAKSVLSLEFVQTTCFA